MPCYLLSQAFGGTPRSRSCRLSGVIPFHKPFGGIPESVFRATWILEDQGGTIETEDLEPVALRWDGWNRGEEVSPVQLDSDVGGCRSSAKPFDGSA